MPVVRCPNCRAELDLDPEDVGHKVECPGCQTAFTAVRPPPEQPRSPDEPPPLPPSPPAPTPPLLPPRGPDDPVVLTCPKCSGSVSVLPDDLGHEVQCPICERVFAAEDPDRPKEKPSRRDDRPTEWRSSRRRREDDDDFDDRPRRRRRSRYEDEDPYDAADPRAWVWRAKKDLTTPGGGLEVLGWVDIAVGILSIVIGIVWAFSDPSAAFGGNGWVGVWLNIGPGVSGLVLGGLKVAGGRAMRQAKNRGLGIAASLAGCVPLNISCCLSPLMVPAYITGIVFGIMGMVQLFNPKVRKAFEVNRPGGDVDGL